MAGSSAPAIESGGRRTWTVAGGLTGGALSGELGCSICGGFRKPVVDETPSTNAAADDGERKV